MKPKSLLLFSGGLDSRLALRLLKEQSKVESVFFLLPFGGGCCNNFECVFNYSQVQGVKLHVIDCTKGKLLCEYLKIIKSPKNGYGTAMNPCKDCKIFMLTQAKKLAEKINADFLATGEVLNQRPMSQRLSDFKLIEKQTKLQDKILRPLSAKLLPKTKAQKSGLINTNKLLSIKGRSRKTQMQLAKKYRIKYPSPAGGCLLCEKEYTPKLKDLFKHKPLGKIKPEDIQLLKIGRHFRSKGKIILGKNHQENQQLELINKKLKYNIIEPTQPGPTAIFEKKSDSKTAKELIKAYSKSSDEKEKFEEIKI